MRKHSIGIIKGDYIGPEIIDAAIKVLDKVGEHLGFTTDKTELLLGGASIDKFGVPLTDETIAQAKEQEAILMGSVGGDPKRDSWYQLEPALRPEAGLLKIRKELELYCNLRPIHLYKELEKASPLKCKLLKNGIDLIIVRELTGGLYFGNRDTYTDNGILTAVDTLIYNEQEIERIGRTAFEIARARRGKLACVDKANVLDSSRLWRKVFDNLKRDYDDVELEYVLVDNAAMQLIKAPDQFDVIVTENMFGDILSDEASVLTGSLGMLPSSSLGAKINKNNKPFGLYEPSGGSAPDIAGKGIANPIAAILSAAMMLEYSLDEVEGANIINRAVERTLQEGYRTADLIISGHHHEEANIVSLGTVQFTDKVIEYINS